MIRSCARLGGARRDDGGRFPDARLEPGPLVFYNSPELIWIVFAAMFYANLSILFIGLIETKTISIC